MSRVRTNTSAAWGRRVSPREMLGHSNDAMRIMYFILLSSLVGLRGALSLRTLVWSLSILLFSDNSSWVLASPIFRHYVFVWEPPKGCKLGSNWSISNRPGVTRRGVTLKELETFSFEFAPALRLILSYRGLPESILILARLISNFTKQEPAN